jgi:DNA polymerase I
MNSTLVLIDGLGLLYRAYFAIPSLSTKSGRPTNAVFGFVRTLRQISDCWKPTHWAVVFDGGSPLDRLKLLPEYKAQRPPMPDALREQIAVVEDYLNRAEIPWSRIAEQEADDVIGALALKAESDGCTVLIATNDKDMYQIVSEKIKLISFSKQATLTGPEDVKKKTGVVPSQIVDWLALAGDSSDNIPGVPGVGGKTAAKLLQQFGSVESLLADSRSLSNEKLKAAIMGNADIVRRNAKIVRLHLPAELQMRWDDMVVRKSDPARVLALLEELEFGSMVQDLKQQELFTI